MDEWTKYYCRRSGILIQIQYSKYNKCQGSNIPYCNDTQWPIQIVVGKRFYCEKQHLRERPYAC